MLRYKNKKITYENEEGQAVFELILFMPFFIFFITIMFTVGNAINSSINQQKVTRRYYYYLSKNNSRYPSYEDLVIWNNGGLNAVGMSGLGWREKQEGGSTGNPISNCYKFNTIFANDYDEECDEPDVNDGATQFIRVFTYYGICGMNYRSSPSSNQLVADYLSSFNAGACTNR
ncbi:hypothetical protein OAT67_00070 [Bacteriovoracaceae bacterium]|nr:hypothetical protein [Bacteriovoracaceae bacterium]|tara:strand:+ start:289340 stop:289861 length:522 start_codon:yes stop_codon:yes gene_type:complete